MVIVMNDSPRSVIRLLPESDCKLVDRVHVMELVRQYERKCGVDIFSHFKGVDFVEFYECSKTEFRFWWPRDIAGNDAFYELLQSAWPNYYKTDRWEYHLARKYMNKNSNCLEIGCGRGYFLKSIEDKERSSIGIEFNRIAVKEKVCSSEIYLENLFSLSEKQGGFDNIFCFQVLEHVKEPLELLQKAMSMLSAGGRFIVSVPNNDYWMYKERLDPFDLPPHHLNAFTPDSLKNISKCLGFNLDVLEIEPAYYPRYSLMEYRGGSVSKLCMGAGLLLCDLAVGFSRVPGPNMMFVLRNKD